jgi:hypothetical protein
VCGQRARGPMAFFLRTAALANMGSERQGAAASAGELSHSLTCQLAASQLVGPIPLPSLGFPRGCVAALCHWPGPRDWRLWGGVVRCEVRKAPLPCPPSVQVAIAIAMPR